MIPITANTRIAIVLALMLSAIPHTLAAQPIETPEGSMVFGPIAIVPTLELRNIGYDSNVFHEETNPKGDVSGQFVPAADYQMRIGRLAMSGRTSVAFVYFQQFAGQRSIDVVQNANVAIRLNRLEPYINGRLVNTKQRPGLDIDLRVRRLRTLLVAGVDALVTGKTTVGVLASAEHESFAAPARVDGVSLREQLNNRREAVAVEVRHALTPLTTVALMVERDQQAFSYDPARDADSLRIAPRVEFKPSALIQGSAMIGHRRVQPRSALIEEFSGLIAATDLTYTFRGTTRFSVVAERNLVYSYRINYPYYVLTGGTISVRQQLATAWDVHGWVGRQRLDYRQRLGIPAGGTESGTAVTEGNVYGGGLGFRLGRATRLTLDVGRSRRDAGVIGRDFEGWHSGVSVFYGF